MCSQPKLHESKRTLKSFRRKELWSKQEAMKRKPHTHTKRVITIISMRVSVAPSNHPLIFTTFNEPTNAWTSITCQSTTNLWNHFILFRFFFFHFLNENLSHKGTLLHLKCTPINKECTGIWFDSYYLPNISEGTPAKGVSFSISQKDINQFPKLFFVVEWHEVMLWSLCCYFG